MQINVFHECKATMWIILPHFLSHLENFLKASWSVPLYFFCIFEVFEGG